MSGMVQVDTAECHDGSHTKQSNDRQQVRQVTSHSGSVHGPLHDCHNNHVLILTLHKSIARLASRFSSTASISQFVATSHSLHHCLGSRTVHVETAALLTV